MTRPVFIYKKNYYLCDMKATLTFDLPEDNVEFTHAKNGSNYAFIISEFDNWLRNEQKYQGVETICVTEVRDKLREFCEDNGILFGEIDK